MAKLILNDFQEEMKRIYTDLYVIKIDIVEYIYFHSSENSYHDMCFEWDLIHSSSGMFTIYYYIIHIYSILKSKYWRSKE